MNIVTKTYSGRYIVRPDTTWERDCEDFFPPEEVDVLSYTPVLFARVSKPGRSVGQAFADRYYDAIGVGVLLYPQCMLDGSAEGFACASCMDHTSFLPYPLFNKVTLGQGNEFRLTVHKDGKPARKAFAFSEATAEMVESAIAGATKYVYIRIGDLVAIELAPRKRLCCRADGTVEVRMCWGEGQAMDFKIRY